MECKLFLDTNALLNLGENAFKERFIIAQKTLEEIENIKISSNKDSEIKYKARNIARLLDINESGYDIIAYSPEIKKIIDEHFLSETPDNIILASAYYYQYERSGAGAPGDRPTYARKWWDYFQNNPPDRDIPVWLLFKFQKR